MIKKIFVFCVLFSFAHISYPESGVDKQAEKIYQDCLEENEADTCTSGCGMILYACKELKEDFLGQHGVKNEQERRADFPVSRVNGSARPVSDRADGVKKPSYPAFESIVANLGPGCQFKLEVPITGKFTSGVASGTGAASIILNNPPYWNDDWFLGFTCYNAGADTVPPKNDTVAFDSKKQRWIKSPANTDIIPEQHLKIYQIKTPNAQGWAYTGDDTAVEHPERRLQYCVYYGERAICGETRVGYTETVRSHPIADRTPYVLKILNSIEFLDDAPPPPGNADIHP